MGLRSPINYTAPLDSTSLIVEIASSAYAFKSKIKAASIKLLWEKLSESVASTLKQQKGCLLPNLGTFKVGPVVGEAKKKIRPVFVLLEGRYGNISQERPRYTVGGRAPIVQPSYTQLSVASGVHKGATQRLVAELLQRLSVHILAGRPIRCEFPGLGTLLTNRAGRMEFVFEPLFMEHFEREHYALIKEMDTQVDVDGQDDISNRMQAVSIGTPTIHHPFNLQNGAGKANGVIRPVSPLIHGNSVQPSRSHTPVSQQAVGGHSQRQAVLSARHATFTGELHKLHQLCMQADRIHAGTVQRSLLEGYLQADVRSLMSQVDAVTVLDLLSTYTCGKTRSLVVYLPFLQALQNLLTSDNPSQEPPRHQYRSSKPQQVEDAADPDQVSELSFNPASPNPNTNPPIHLSAQQESYQIQPQYQHQPQEHQQAGMTGAWTPQQPRNAAVVRQLNAQQQGAMPGSITAAPAYQQPAGLQQGLNVVVPAVPPSPAPSQPEQYIHYMQQQLSPRSRAEYDSFNKVHFEHLRQMRGDSKRALTPKVNEEPLNKTEFRAVQQASPRSAWLATPTHDNPAPPTYQPYINGNGITQAPTPNRPTAYTASQQPPLPFSNAATYNSSSAPMNTTSQRPPAYPAYTTANTSDGPAPGYVSGAVQSPATAVVVPGLPLASYVTSPVQNLRSPPRGYHPRDHVQDILHDLPRRSMAQQQQQQLTYQQEPSQLSPRYPPYPISYYDIQSARDPAEKQRLKAELANELQQSWRRQIETRHEFERAVEQAEKSGWPYNLSHNPNDKRPVSAISRPLASPRRISRP